MNSYFDRKYSRWHGGGSVCVVVCVGGPGGEGKGRRRKERKRERGEGRRVKREGWSRGETGRRGRETFGGVIAKTLGTLPSDTKREC